MKNKISVIAITCISVFSILGFAFKKENLDDSKKIFCEKIDIVCDQFPPNTEKIINTELEYKKLFESSSKHETCKEIIPPAIDFNKHTLIGIYTSIKGCSGTKSEHHLSSSEDGTGVSFFLTITTAGMCKRLNYYKIWCIIDKVNDPNKISFSIIKKDA